MGQTIRTLAVKPLPEKSVFHTRFVIEVCEAVHVHYRNLRILLSLPKFLTIAAAFKDALERWTRRGEPETRKGTHIELARLNISADDDAMIRINLNRNLYPEHDGKIFAEGAEIKEDNYIHVKIRDLRLEMSIEEFETIKMAFEEAGARLVAGKEVDDT